MSQTQGLNLPKVIQSQVQPNPALKRLNLIAEACSPKKHPESCLAKFGDAMHLSDGALEVETNFAQIICGCVERGIPFAYGQGIKLLREILDPDFSIMVEEFWTHNIDLTQSLHRPEKIGKELEILTGLELPQSVEGVYLTANNSLKDIPHHLIQRFLQARKNRHARTFLEGLIQNSYGGRVFPYIHTVGAVSGRAIYSDPNITGTPGAGTRYGSQLRQLIGPGSGRLMLGMDAKQIELRFLAHFLSKNEPKSVKLLLSGDIYEEIAQRFGVNRNVAKSIFFAMLYGAGSGKLQELAGTSKPFRRIEILGTIPGLEEFETRLHTYCKTHGFIQSIDGRRISIDEGDEYLSLNYLLQSSATFAMKLFTVRLLEQLRQTGLKDPIDFQLLLFIHDELQFSINSKALEIIERQVPRALRKVEHELGLHIPLEMSIKVGSNWAETH